MLAIGVEYLLGWAMATDPANRSAPEWPPHPDRIFMALAAAHFETEGDMIERGALEWLETIVRDIGQPSLLTSDHQERTTVTTFVPVNDTASPIKKNKALMSMGAMPIGRDRQARCFPVAIPRDAITYLAWDRADPTADQVRSLQRLCEKVTSVGHSASLVRMWVADSIPPERRGPPADGSPFLKLVPSDGLSSDRLRVFGPGRLADLEARYNQPAINEFSRLEAELATAKGKRKQEIRSELDVRFGGGIPQPQRPVPSLWQGYALGAAVEDAKAQRGTQFSPDLLILRQVSGPTFTLESTLLLTEALRNCAMRECPEPLPEWLSGHQAGGRRSERGHIAFVPLPHVGHPHAEGHLLGIAIATPRDTPRRELAECLGPLLYEQSGSQAGRPHSIRLTLGSLGVCALELVDRRESRAALRSSTWCATFRPASRWATVTPFAFDRHAKGDQPWGDLEESVSIACERIGLPRPVKVVATPVSMFVGAPPARDMPRIERKTGGKIRQSHAVITFGEPVVGPVLLGAGRYRGYGFCRPLSEDWTQ